MGTERFTIPAMYMIVKWILCRDLNVGKKKKSKLSSIIKLVGIKKSTRGDL